MDVTCKNTCYVNTCKVMALRSSNLRYTVHTECTYHPSRTVCVTFHNLLVLNVTGNTDNKNKNGNVIYIVTLVALL
jgi:hypothetical protein